MITIKRIHKDKERHREFGELSVNQAFVYDNSIYIKTDEEFVDDNGCPQNAICIESSKSDEVSGTSYFRPSTTVVKVNLEIRVKG